MLTVAGNPGCGEYFPFEATSQCCVSAARSAALGAGGGGGAASLTPASKPLGAASLPSSSPAPASGSRPSPASFFPLLLPASSCGVAVVGDEPLPPVTSPKET